MEVSQSFVDAEIASTVGKEQSVLCDSRGQFTCSEIVVVDIYQGAQAKAEVITCQIMDSNANFGFEWPQLASTCSSTWWWGWEGEGEGVGDVAEEVVVELTFCLWLNYQPCFIVSVDWSHVSSNHDTRKAQSIGLFQHPE